MYDIDDYHGNGIGVRGPSTEAEKKERHCLKNRMAARKYRMKKRAQSIALRPTRTECTSVLSGNKEIHSVVDDCSSKKPEQWSSILKENLRVLHRPTMIYDDNSSLAFAHDPKSRSVKCFPAREVGNREYVIQIKNGEEKWMDLYDIKQSTIPGAGYGLFALQSFVQGEVMGVYSGNVVEVFHKRDVEHEYEYKPNSYTVLWKSDKKKDVYIQQHPISTRNKSQKHPPVGFGFHFCNGADYRNEAVDSKSQSVHTANVYMSDEKLVIRATTKIDIGTELLLDYNYGGNK
eukprot:scaffold19822_cov57-Cylindrotheca_fusiformis.AAC.4